jgi:selenide,water dikinase
MARGADLTPEIFADGPVILPGVEALAQAGVRTGASGRNWASYGAAVRGAGALPAWKKDILCDPQTSGGLLVAVDPAEAETVLKVFRERGFSHASVVGRLKDGPSEVEIV